MNMNLFWEVEAEVEYRCPNTTDEDVRVLVSACTLSEAVSKVVRRFRLSGNARVTIKCVFPADITHILE